MSYRIIVFLFLFLTNTFAYDFIRDALSRIDTNSDPCDDFYRHACPRGNYSLLMETKYKPIMEDLLVKRKNLVWENLEVMKAFEEIRFDEMEDNIGDHIVNSFRNICENNSPHKKEFLLHVQQMITESYTSKCMKSFCLPSLSSYPNCTYVVEVLEKILSKMSNASPKSYRSPLSLSPESYLFSLKNETERHIELLRMANVIIEGNYENGVRLVNSFTKDIIKDTPWVKNNHMEEMVEEIASGIHVYDNYGMEMKQNIEILMNVEEIYLKCAKEFSGKQNLFCLLFTKTFATLESTSSGFFIKLNARNRHPYTLFSTQFYAVAAESEEMAGKFGSVGHIAGHEISHSVIEDPNNLAFFPYSSSDAIQCIQNQFNKTCQEFREKYCDTRSIQIDENGSDILGLQLAYQLFENHYKDKAQNEYLRIRNVTVTYQKLFFYASAFVSCQGTPQLNSDNHSVYNIRGNVVAQHPAFKEAFQCAPDSRMMRTVEKQCIVFGKEAPERRK